MSDIAGFHAELKIDFPNYDVLVGQLNNLTAMIKDMSVAVGSVQTGFRGLRVPSSGSGTPSGGGGGNIRVAALMRNYQNEQELKKEEVASNKEWEKLRREAIKKTQDEEKNRVSSLMRNYQNEQELKKEEVADRRELLARNRESQERHNEIMSGAANVVGTAFKWLAGISLTVGAGLLAMLAKGNQAALETGISAPQLGMTTTRLRAWEQLGAIALGDNGPGVIKQALQAMQSFALDPKLTGKFNDQIAILMSTGLKELFPKDFLTKKPEDMLSDLISASQKVLGNPKSSEEQKRMMYEAMRLITGGTGIGGVVQYLGNQNPQDWIRERESGNKTTAQSLKTMADTQILLNKVGQDFSDAMNPFIADFDLFMSKPIKEFDSYLRSGKFGKDLRAFIDASYDLIKQLINSLTSFFSDLKDAFSMIKSFFAGGDTSEIVWSNYARNFPGAKISRAEAQGMDVWDLFFKEKMNAKRESEIASDFQDNATKIDRIIDFKKLFDSVVPSANAKEWIGALNKKLSTVAPGEMFAGTIDEVSGILTGLKLVESGKKTLWSTDFSKNTALTPMLGGNPFVTFLSILGKQPSYAPTLFPSQAGGSTGEVSDRTLSALTKIAEFFGTKDAPGGTVDRPSLNINIKVDQSGRVVDTKVSSFQIQSRLAVSQ